MVSTYTTCTRLVIHTLGAVQRIESLLLLIFPICELFVDLLFGVFDLIVYPVFCKTKISPSAELSLLMNKRSPAASHSMAARRQQVLVVRPGELQEPSLGDLMTSTPKGMSYHLVLMRTSSLLWTHKSPHLTPLHLYRILFLWTPSSQVRYLACRPPLVHHRRR